MKEVKILELLVQQPQRADMAKISACQPIAIFAISAFSMPVFALTFLN